MFLNEKTSPLLLVSPSRRKKVQFPAAYISLFPKRDLLSSFCLFALFEQLKIKKKVYRHLVEQERKATFHGGACARAVKVPSAAAGPRQQERHHKHTFSHDGI